uniref:Uncharacterized protein n=1 Tax=Picea glauca TaxID=3330 RepID=A0A117NIP7_PICGL|nr:hypothetical protein ABT39_MTgene82 [Picea glauca]KUM50258.1 hypothetical protein ABT39_MTgene101 [Picea glauca]QHR90749.1 hypothetical protein Q903MT_gene4775 [Picea sitchensis]
MHHPTYAQTSCLSQERNAYLVEWYRTYFMINPFTFTVTNRAPCSFSLPTSIPYITS